MKIAFLGDIALIGKYDITINSHCKERLKVMAEKLNEFDYVVANLESPLTEKTKSWVCKSMHLRTPVVNVELLNYLNVNAVSIANNHIYDFGQKGLEETIAVLESNSIEWFGADAKHLIKEINGVKVCLSGFCCYSTNGTGYIQNQNRKGVNTLTYDNVMKQLEEDKINNVFSILSFHWGTEHTNYPNLEHISLARKIAERKTVIIHGHHPHVVQGVQKIDGSLIAYSLGNFLFDDCKSLNGKFALKQTEDNKKSYVLEVEIKNNAIVDYEFKGFKDEDQGFVFFNISNEIEQISEALEQLDDEVSYEFKRKEQFEKAIQNKFGKHDLKWLMSRLNYYSIGARISAKFRSKKYRREMEKFLND
jgi:hypothetical protein